MNSIDFILNIVGLLLWFNWRAVHISSVERAISPLAFTLKSASSPRPRLLYLGILFGLLLIRALFYYEIGPALPWTPHLSLGCTNLIFRSDSVLRMIFYSFMSFGATFGVSYLSFLLLSAINSDLSDEIPQHRFIQLHLGIVRHWPRSLQLALPLFLSLLAWIAIHPLLVRFQMAPQSSTWHVIEQGLIIGTLVYLQLEYIIAGILVLHLLNNYVYMGDFSLWKYIDLTAAKFLAPLRQPWLPLIIKRIDLAPVICLALVIQIFALLKWASSSHWAVHQFQRLAS